MYPRPLSLPYVFIHQDAQSAIFAALPLHILTKLKHMIIDCEGSDGGFFVVGFVLQPHACYMYNMLLADQRLVGAALLPVTKVQT